MLTRRDVLTRGATLLLLVPVIGCTTSSSTPPPGPGGTCAGTDVTSSVDAAHLHTVCVLSSDLTNPPPGGVTYITSSNGEHTHNVTLSAANLTAINGGQTVMVTSTSDVDPINGAAHTHTFMIKKA